MAEPNLPTRNNNPLNIKLGPATQKWIDSGDAEIGDKATDGGNFLKFKSAEKGFEAAKDLLFNNSSYNTLDVDSALKRWSNSGYGGDISPEISSRSMNDLSEYEKSDLIDRMAKREGFNTGDDTLKVNPPNANLKTYKITNRQTGDVFTMRSSSPPTQDDARRISEGRRKTLESQAQADTTRRNEPLSAKLYDYLAAPSEAISPSPMAQSEVEKLPVHQRVGRLLQEAGAGMVSPEVVATAPLALTGVGAAALPIAFSAQMASQAPKAVEQAYQKPSLETVGRAGLLGLGILGTGYAGVKRGAAGINVKAPVENGPLDTSVSTSNIRVQPKGLLPEGQGEFTDVPFEVKSPEQRQIPGGQRQLGTGRTLTTEPKPGQVTESYAKAGKSGIANLDENEIFPIEEKAPEPVQQTEPINTPPPIVAAPPVPSTTTSTTPAVTNPNQKPITNNWLRQMETPVLQSMYPGATGDLRNEIKTVLDERNPQQSTSVQVQPPGKTIFTEKKSEIPEETSNFNDAKYKEYTDSLDSMSDRPQIASGDLRSVAQLAKDSGLTEEEFVEDAADKLGHITNIVNKASAAAKRIYGGEGEDLISKMETTDAEGNTRAVAGMDPRIVKVLGSNLYSGDLGKIASKEMLQNAIDSVRSKGSKGVVRFFYDEKDGNKIAHIVDNGTGMLPDVARNEFVDIGGSKKEEGATGGFGIAKVAIFANAKEINVTTTAKDAQGKYWTTKLSGSGEDWIDTRKGLKINTVESDPKSTGTSLQIIFNKETKIDPYSMQNYLGEFLQNHKLPNLFDFRINNEEVKPGYGWRTAEQNLERRADNKVGTLNFPGGKADVYVSNTTQETEHISVKVLNNGMPQFNQDKYLSGKRKVPTNVTINVIPASTPIDADYPFRPDREGLRDEAKEAVNKWVGDKLVSAAAAKELNAYKAALTNAKTFNIAGPDKNKFRIYDTEQNVTPEIMKEIQGNYELAKLTHAIGEVHNAIQDALARIDRDYDNSDFGGIGLGRGYLGINIDGKLATGQEDSPNIILHNPFVALKEVDSLRTLGGISNEDVNTTFANQIVATILHEVTHNLERNHEQGFSGALTRNIGHTNRIVEKLSKRIEGKLTDELIQNIRETSGKIDAITKGEDLFSKIGTSTTTILPKPEGISIRSPESSGFNESGRIEQQPSITVSNPNSPEELGTSKPGNTKSGLQSFLADEEGSLKIDELGEKLKSIIPGISESIHNFMDLMDRTIPIRYRPEQIIGKMGDSGKFLEQQIENAQYYSDRLRGKVDLLTHDAFAGLTPREIGQRIAVMNNGKEVILNRNNFDKYVTWEDGVYTPKEGVAKIIRMKGSLSNVINDGAEPANQKIAQAAQNFKDAMNILGTEGEKSNVSTITGEGNKIPFIKMGENYWPHDYTKGFYDSLDLRDWEKIARDVANKNGISIAEARELLKNKKLYSELTTREQHQRFFKQDSFVIDPELVFEHTRRFSGRIGMAQALGSKDVMGGLIGDELTNLANEGFDSRFAEDTIKRLVGRVDRPQQNPTANKIYNAITGLNNARLMTSFVLNNLANITTSVARVGELNTLRGAAAMLGNMEMSRRMAILSGAAEHTGTIEGADLSISKMLGVPMSERFMRTWADQTGRVTADGLVDYLKKLSPHDPKFERVKPLLDSILGRDSSDAITNGLTDEDYSRAGWQLAKDTQGIINPGTMPSLGETIQNPGLRMMVNLAMQYKRMSMLGMNSIAESFRLNPARTLRALLITAPIIGELIGDAGSAIFGGLSGTLTGEGGAKAAVRDVEDRGKSLARAAKPLLQNRLGLSEDQANKVGRYVDDMNRGFALGLIGDFLYSVAYWGGQAGPDIVSGGIAPAFEFVYDIAKDIMNTGKDQLYATPQEQIGNIGKNLLLDTIPQRIGSGYRRSEKSMGKGGGSGITVRPPRLPSGL